MIRSKLHSSQISQFHLSSMSNDSTQGTGPQLRRRQLAASRSLGDVFFWGEKAVENVMILGVLRKYFIFSVEI